MGVGEPGAISEYQRTGTWKFTTGGVLLEGPFGHMTREVERLIPTESGRLRLSKWSVLIPRLGGVYLREIVISLPLHKRK